ncbi:MAG: hypothetical protein CVV19_00850 [Gammaproteobacteria bacterium HGW-Gammaproteobacteria-9]|nr:MAG: hypothetical protein CVV19_00850 [Gammaproteobacteria bacterium HGW-Gammaproteobacteria-9]
MTFNTGNPVGSTDARDLYDNAQNFDKFSIGEEQSYQDRLGVLRKSIAGMEADFATFLAESGFEPEALQYVDGSPLTVDRPTQLITRAATPGIMYSVKLPSSFPKTLSGTWSADESLLIVRVDSSLRTELAAATGASLVGYRGKSLDFYQGLKVSPYAYGAVGDGVADDSVPVQQAIDAITAAGGGTLELFGRFLVGGLIVDTPYVLITGRSERDQLIVKGGTLGVHVKQHWVNFENITVKSQGTKGDGLGTNGILYDKGGNLSTGFVFNQNLTVTGFSGYGVKVVNAISYTWQRCYVVGCTTGVEFARDAGGLSFGTTVFFDNVYVTSCTTGIKGDRLYRSHFNVIGESCDYAMDMFVGDFTLYRCYFEKNFILGVRAQNCAVQDLFTYSNNATTDAVSITFQSGVVAAPDRGYMRQNQYDIIAKRLAVLAGYGVDPYYLAGHGTSQNLGLKYGESTVALVRGANLLDPSAWAPQRSAELIGWSHLKQGYEISGTSAGDLTHGMQQTVTLDSTKTYVLDFRYTPISGTISTLRVGSDVVTSGVPFKPSANGANVVKAFGASASTGLAFEMYVHAFTLAEVVADAGQVAEANDRLTRQKQGRGVQYASAAPTTGRWRQGEIVYNTAPNAGGFVGWVCVVSGSPGTWKTFGSITA